MTDRFDQAGMPTECLGHSTEGRDGIVTTRKYKSNREDFGTIRQRANGRFQASYLGPDKVRYYGPVTYTAKTDARAWLRGVHHDIGAGTWVSPTVKEQQEQAIPVFKTYATTWVSQRFSAKGAPLRPRTRAEYLRFLEKGLSHFADDRLPAITPARIRQWHSKRIEDAGATAAAKEAQFLRAILNTAVVDEIIGKNPVLSKLTRTSTGQEHRPPTADELATILDTIDAEFRFAVVLAAVAGLRIGEWKALRRRDFSLTEDGRYAVHITRQAQWVPGTGWVVGEPKSRAGVRVQILPESATADVEHHLTTYVGAFPDSLLWQPKRRRSAFIHDSAFRDAWDPAREAAGVKGVVREHDLRHYALTEFAKTGATLAEVQAFGGHSRHESAMRYQYAAADRLAELANLVPALPKPKPSNVRDIVPSGR
jgi:integrase